jgi:uncharacterized membrane protein YqaE (UPF0057 family)
MAFTASDICKILLAIILPPLGVFLERGCNADFLINILLTVLGYIPVSSANNTLLHDLLLTLLGYHPRSVHHLQVLSGARKRTLRCCDNGTTTNDTHLLSLSASFKASTTLDSRRHLSIFATLAPDIPVLPVERV